MRAVVITKAGGPEVLEVRDVATPEPGPEQVRVRVRATALNRADLLQRMGMYPAPPGVPKDIPGLEFAGTVDALGPGAHAWAVGDRVFGLVGGGSYAEYVVVHERTLARVPERLDDTKAAAVPEAFITAHDAMIVQAGLRTGDSVLVHAVGSGVGLAALQLARALRANVFGTSRTPDKLERAKAFGLAHGMLAEKFDESVLAQTKKRGVDVIVDFVGADYLDANLRALAPRGRMIVVGTMGGVRAEIDLAAVLRKRLHVMGTVLRARPLEEKIDANQAFAREVLPLLADGTVEPVVDTVFPLEGIREAHERLASNATFGKVVVTIG